MIDVVASLLPFIKDTTRLHLTFEKNSEGEDYLFKLEAEGRIEEIVLDADAQAEEEAEEEPVATYLDGTPM